MVSLIYLERSKNKKNISKKTNKLEDQADVEGSVSASSLVLKPLLVFSEQENILADSKPHLDPDQTPQADFLLITTTTSRNTATRSRIRTTPTTTTTNNTIKTTTKIANSKQRTRKIKFGTKLSNSHQAERLELIKLMNQTHKPQNSSGEEMDKSIKYNLVEDVTVNHQSNLADIPMTRVQSDSILKSDDQARTKDQLRDEGTLAGRETPTSTSVLKQLNAVTRINEGWETSGSTTAAAISSEDKWGDQLQLTFNSVGSGGGGGGAEVPGKQSFIVLIS